MKILKNIFYSKMKQTVILILSVFLFSCKEDRSEVEKVRAEVFVIHDEVMPKMDKLMELREAITQEITIADSIIKISKNETMAVKKSTALSIGQDLDDADREMMDWMQQYKDDSVNTMTKEKAIEYLNFEKKKIIVVRDKMLESINKAQKFTDSNP